LLERQMRGLVVKRLRGSDSEHVREALVALASQATTHGAREGLRKEIRRQATITNYPLRWPTHLATVAQDARCAFLRGGVAQAMVIDGALCLLGIALLVAASYHLPRLSSTSAPTAVISGLASGFLYVLSAVSSDLPAVAFLRAELAGATLAASMFGTVLGM